MTPAPRPASRWWTEALGVVVLYASYSVVRGKVGGDTATAFANAEMVLGIERRLGLDSELAVQQAFLTMPWLVRAMNIAYGTFHFVVPILTLVVLARRAPHRYRLARNALVATTLLALVGFAAFPLMPPRLLCVCAGGAGVDAGYVDTLAAFGGLWTFGNHAVTAVSNPYAAMPSLHFAWALWVPLALGGVLTGRTSRALATLYPVATLLVIVVTGNHYWLDALGGAAVVAAGWALAGIAERRRPRRAATGDLPIGRTERYREQPTPEVVPAPEQQPSP